eukprot:gene7513-10235_t
MGNGVSTLPLEKKEILTKELKSAYGLSLQQGLTDEEIMMKMIDEYNNMMGKLSSSKVIEDEPLDHSVSAVTIPLIPSTIHTTSIDEGGSSKKTNKSTPASTPKPAQNANSMSIAKKSYRRRSFDNHSTKKPVESTVVSPNKDNKMEALREEPAQADNDETEATDTWDSVTQQPFCNICQMAFKSPAFLDRHVKYSDLHSKNKANQKDSLNKANDEIIQKKEEEIAQAAKEAEEKAIQEEKLKQPMKEGIDFSLLYDGSKLFWRTQRSVDINIYNHIPLETLEIIAFDAVTHKELPRIYINYKLLCEIIQPKLDASVEAKYNELILDRFNTVTKEQLYDEQKPAAVITYILQRLSEDSSDSIDSRMKPIVYTPALSVDDINNLPLRPSPPLLLKPIHVSRRRRTSGEEISEAFNELSYHTQRASEHIKTAHTLHSAASTQA